jgi:hypothetical protein
MQTRAGIQEFIEKKLRNKESSFSKQSGANVLSSVDFH